MISLAVSRFIDESLGRIVPVELIRLADKKQFAPASAKDLPEENVQIKWQKSQADGSFFEDGFFEAEILALAGSLETARAKAAELNIRLHPNPLLALPSAPSRSKSVSPGGKRRSRKMTKSTLNNNQQEIESGTTIKKEEKKPRDSHKKRSKSCLAKDNSKGSAPKRLRMNDVSIKRTSTQAEVASSQNPLVKDMDKENASGTETKKDDGGKDDARAEVADFASKKPLSSASASEEDNSEDDLLDTTIAVDDENLDTEMRDMPSPRSTSSSASSSSETEADDDVVKLSREKEMLSKELKQVKDSLEQSKRDAVLANNLRLAQKEQLLKAKKELEEKSKEVRTLQKRNEVLQDLLCSKGSASKVKSPSPFSPRKEFVSTPDKNRPSPKKRGSPAKKSLFDESFGSPDADSSKNTSGNGSNSREKKKKRIKDTDLLNDTTVCEVSQQILDHFKGINCLLPDEKGFVSVGPHKVKLDLKALERNLEDYKGDFTKLAKSMAPLIWTSSQREERSLEGGINNRFPNAPPKKAATPFKVNTCLGVLKAHLLNQGDREGGGMAQNLKQARKSIGNKFAQDCAMSKKRS